jgi:hypothetical protein
MSFFPDFIPLSLFPVFFEGRGLAVLSTSDGIGREILLRTLSLVTSPVKNRGGHNRGGVGRAGRRA